MQLYLTLYRLQERCFKGPQNFSLSCQDPMIHESICAPRVLFEGLRVPVALGSRFSAVKRRDPDTQFSLRVPGSLVILLCFHAGLRRIFSSGQVFFGLDNEQQHTVQKMVHNGSYGRIKKNSSSFQKIQPSGSNCIGYYPIII